MRERRVLCVLYDKAGTTGKGGARKIRKCAERDIRRRGLGEREQAAVRIDIFNTDRKYDVIYADPPWAYKVYSDKGHGRSAESHYPTMGIEDIKALPVGEIAKKDCTLFMWATFPCLKEALAAIEAWEFTYKTVAFVWVKQNRKSDGLFFGLGHWTRANAEICILATRGHPKRASAKVHQIIMSHIEEHSKKPHEVRERIVALMGESGERIELFARQYPDGWDVWGNEV